MGEIILGIYVLLGLAVLAIIIYLIADRIQKRKSEDFEKRDN
jgi:phage shock protein PspC (stress-responsive transcriptional regulator)